jgi:plasmid stabilization system protein ParE
MKLHVTEQAADQIAAINAYLAERSPLGARNVQLAMDATFMQLTHFPGLGRRQRTVGVRCGADQVNVHGPIVSW